MASSCCCHPSHSFSYGFLPSKPPNPKRTSLLSCSPPRTIFASVKMGLQDIAEVLQNKVLVAATVASVVGQLSKPFTSALKGEGFDLKRATGSGGMPSTHSAAVVAVVTSLGLERGFADSIFGMSVVFAAIVMYDSQGVRREVGNHAKSLNALKGIQQRRLLYLSNDDLVDVNSENAVNSKSLISVLSVSEKNSLTASEEPLPSSNSGQVLTRSDAAPSKRGVSDEQPDPVEDAFGDALRLNESVGHTEIQVLAGAFLGLLAGLAIETVL